MQLIGYGGLSSCLVLKLYNFPFVEIYVPRKNGDAAYTPCGLTKSKKDDVLASALARELFETKGDALAYVGVLVDYYRASNSGLQTTISTKLKADASRQEQVQDESVNRVRDCIFGDISESKIKDFASEVDRVYESALGDCINYSYYNGSLTSEEMNVYFYNKFKAEFPFIHLVMYSMVETKRFKEDVTTSKNSGRKFLPD